MFGHADSLNVYSLVYRRGTFGSLTASATSAVSLTATMTSATNLTTSTLTTRFAQSSNLNMNFAERMWLTFPSFSALGSQATVTLAVIDGARYGSCTLWFDSVVGNPSETFEVCPVVARSTGLALTMSCIDLTNSESFSTSDPLKVVSLYHTRTNASIHFGNTLTVSPSEVYTITFHRLGGAWVAGQSVSAIGGWVVPLS